MGYVFTHVLGKPSIFAIFDTINYKHQRLGRLQQVPLGFCEIKAFIDKGMF